jgi:hypothetical protein
VGPGGAGYQPALQQGRLAAAARQVRAAWARSRAYRVVLCVVLAYTGLRLAAQVLFLSGAFTAEPGQGVPIPEDLRVYLQAAADFQARRDLYQAGPLDRVEFYQYAPAFALAFAPFLWLAPGWLLIVQSLIHVAAYALLYLRWAALFERPGLERAGPMLAWTLPLWLIYPSFWADWAYMNTYVVAALVGTLLLESVLDERLGRSALWLTVLLQFKPHWAFAAAVPLLLGRWRYFLQLAAGALGGYAVVLAGLALAAGPGYVLEQHLEYIGFLASLAANFPWREQAAGFQGYNHSVLQTLIFWLGDGPAARALALAGKAGLTLPLALAGLRLAWQPPDPGVGRPWPGLTASQGRLEVAATPAKPAYAGWGQAAPAQPDGAWPGRATAGQEWRMHPLALDLAFALYLAAFVWLDWVWELSLGMPLLAYLLATEDRRARAWVLGVFVPFALLDFWQLVSVAAGGESVVAGAYILTDPSIYAPMTLAVILLLYSLLLRRLLAWPAASRRAAAALPG